MRIRDQAWYTARSQRGGRQIIDALESCLHDAVQSSFPILRHEPGNAIIVNTMRRLLGRFDVPLGVLALLPLVSALRSPAFPLSLRIAVAVLWGVAVWRPNRALIALTLIVPFGSVMLAWLDAAPVRVTEAFVLAVLSGAVIAPRRDGVDQNARLGSIALPAVVFGAIVACSAAVVLASRGIGLPAWTVIRDTGRFLTDDYLIGPAPEFSGFADAARLLEGVGLVWVVWRRAGESTATLVRAFAIASAATAMLGFSQLWAIVTTASGFPAALTELLRFRTGAHVTDVNAAGSYYAMATCTVLALALDRRRPRAIRAAWAWVAAGLTAAVWLSGSRMALVAAIGGAVVVAVSPRLSIARERRWAVVMVALVATAALVAVAIGLDPRPSATRTASHAVRARADFMLTGLRMIASAPVFGVGVGRYFEVSGRFMPSSIYWFYFHENAHNNFLQIAGELGVLGLAAFVWLLTAAATRIVRALRARRDDALLVATGAGTATFVVTWLTSHPLLVPEVAYAFWMLLGTALSRADAVVDAGPGPVVDAAAGRRARERALPVMVAGFVALLVGSVPVRARGVNATEPRDQLTFGFYDWEGDHVFPYRWSSRRATFFVPARAREVGLVIRSMMIPGHMDPVTVTVAVSGRVLDRFEVNGDWHTVQLRLPPASAADEHVRVDLISDPTWSPAATGVSHDVRILGIPVGAPQIR